ncbi:hypothetical protein Tco_1213431 [Tanacetum coccineum]
MKIHTQKGLVATDKTMKILIGARNLMLEPVTYANDVHELELKQDDGNPEEDLKDYAIIDSGAWKITGDKTSCPDFK